jgi:hypothetical protein
LGAKAYSFGQWFQSLATLQFPDSGLDAYAVWQEITSIMGVVQPDGSITGGTPQENQCLYQLTKAVLDCLAGPKSGPETTWLQFVVDPGLTPSGHTVNVTAAPIVLPAYPAGGQTVTVTCPT